MNPCFRLSELDLRAKCVDELQVDEFPVGMQFVFPTRLHHKLTSPKSMSPPSSYLEDGSIIK